MDEIYANVDDGKPDKFNISTSPTGPTSSERRCLRAVVLSLSLLSVFLLAGLIGLGVHCGSELHSGRKDHGLAAEFSSVEANLTEYIQKSLSLTEERDQLNSNLTEVTKELQSLKKTCPSGWTMSSGSCYLLSTKSGSWDKGRENCRGRGADLVIVDCTEEQTFLTGLPSASVWIGLTDREKEGTWKWVDGTPLTLSYWGTNQPDNGGGDPKYGEEDCGQIWRDGEQKWNDLRCDESLRWICEKKAV